jgi:hypothetical protein
MSDSNDNNKDYELSPFQRNRYFYGKLMTVRDFETEQNYMNGKRYLLNRLVNGAGVVCGLGLADMEVSVTEAGNIKILFKTGGVALDCWGREIVVPIQDTPRQVYVKEESVKTNLTAAEVENYQYYLYLEYDPREGEMVSSALENSSCEETCCPNRVIENFEVIASQAKPVTPTLSCPQPFADKQQVRDWLQQQTSLLGSKPDDSRVFILALKKSVPSSGKIEIDPEETANNLVFVAHNRVLSELVACHLADFTNPHKTTAEQVGALVSIDDVQNDGGNVDLVEDNSIQITSDNGANTITIGETHSPILGENPHQTKHGQLVDVLEILKDYTDDDDKARNKHISNNDAGKWNNAVDELNEHQQDKNNPHQTTAEQVGALSTGGGMVTGKVYIKTEEWNGLAADATKTYGIMGRLTGDLDSGSDYRCAGVVGISEIEGKHGLYARAPEGSHALYVDGSAMFTGAKSGFVADIFRNVSGTTLKTGDLVKLKGTKVHRYYGESHKIPVADVTLADRANDSAVIGIVDSRAVLDEEEPKKKSKKAPDPTLVEDGQELYVVTLGCYARCQVDATKAPIAVGDLLTSSATPGHARKAAPPKIGTIIGKALEPLKKGTGSIAVFVNIQ